MLGKGEQNRHSVGMFTKEPLSTSRLQKVDTIGAPICLAADTPCSLRSRMPHLAKVRSHWDPTSQSCRAYQPLPTRMEAEVSINLSNSHNVSQL